MSEITMDKLRALVKQYIRHNYKTQYGFAKAMKCSQAYVSAVLKGKSNMPLAWAELVGAKITMKISLEQKVEDWQKRSQYLPIQPAPIENTGGKPCMACGKYHYGMTGLPCPTMTPMARAAHKQERANDIKIGAVVQKISIGGFFKVFGFTQGRAFVPDGWPLDQMGIAWNPLDCRVVGHE